MSPAAVLPKRREQDPTRHKKKGQRLGAVRLTGESSNEKRLKNPPAQGTRTSPPPVHLCLSPSNGQQAWGRDVSRQVEAGSSTVEQEQKGAHLHKHFTALLDTGKEAYNAMRQATVELTMGIDSMVEEAVHWAAPVLASPKIVVRSAHNDSPDVAAWNQGNEADTSDAWEESWEPRGQAREVASSSNRKSSDDLFASWGLDWPIKTISPKKALSRSMIDWQQESRDASASHIIGTEDDCDLERQKTMSPVNEERLRNGLRRCQIDLKGMQQRCKRLMKENEALRSRRESMPEPDILAEQVRGQLQALLTEKARLALENACLRREVEGLQDLLDTMHPQESSDEDYSGDWDDGGRIYLQRTCSCDSTFS